MVQIEDSRRWVACWPNRQGWALLLAALTLLVGNEAAGGC